MLLVERAGELALEDRLAIMPGHFSMWLLQDLSKKMKVQHNYLSRITENFQPCRPQLLCSAEESSVFYLANDRNQSFIIYRIKDWGCFDSVVIQCKKLQPPETIGRELMQGKLQAVLGSDFLFSKRKHSHSHNFKSPYITHQ